MLGLHPGYLVSYLAVFIPPLPLIELSAGQVHVHLQDV